MSVLVILDFNVKPGKAGEITEWLRGNLHHTRSFDGCNGISIHSDQDDPNHMVSVAHWDARQHHEKYLAWRTERGDYEKLMGWIAGEPSIRYYNNVGV